MTRDNRSGRSHDDTHDYSIDRITEKIGALIQGINPRAWMTRNRTIMAGDVVCDFEYSFPEPGGTSDHDG